MIFHGTAHVYAFDGGGWSLEQELAHVAHPADPDDGRRHRFGQGTDIDGDIAVVGERDWGVNWDSPFVPGVGADGFDLTSRQGIAHVYTYDDGSGTWSHADFLNLWPDAGYTPAVFDSYFEDLFGYDVAVDADAGAAGAGRIIAGAVGAGPGAWSGQAYVFENDGTGNWNLVGTLTNPDPDFNDYLGAAVDIDGDVAVSGTLSPNTEEGQAYVYQDTGGGWARVADLHALIPGGERFNDNMFGLSVAVEGNTIVVGARDDTSATPGKAYVFQDTGSGWELVDTLTASDGANGDAFGTDVAIDGGRIVVTAMNHDIGATANAGKAYVYEYDSGSGSWVETDQIVRSAASASDRFGSAVDLDSEHLVVGAELDDTTFTNQGAVLAYEAAMSAGGGGAAAFVNSGAMIVGGTVTVEESGTLTNEASGTIEIGDDLTVADAAHLQNDGSVSVGENMDVSGDATVENTSDLTLTVGNDLDLSEGAVFTNTGTLIVEDDIELEDEAVLENTGTVSVAEDVSLEDETHLQNDGTMTVGGAMEVLDEATVENTSDLTLTIAGDLDVSDESELANTGTLAVGDDFDTENEATFENTGTLTVTDNMDVKDDATWTNQGTGTFTGGTMRIYGDSTVVNAGMLALSGEGGLHVAEGGDLTNSGTLTGDYWFAINDEVIDGFAIGSDLAMVENTDTGTITSQGIGVRGFAKLVNDGTITIEDRGTSDHFDLNISNEATGGTAEVINTGIMNVGQDIRMDTFGDAGGSTFTNTGTVSVGVILDIGSTAFSEVTTFDNQGSGTVGAGILQTRGVAEFTSSGTVEVGDDLNVKNDSSVFNAGDLTILGDDINVENDATFGNTGTTTIADGLFVRQDAHVDNFGAGTLNTFSVQLRDSATMLNAGTLAGARVNVNEGGTLTNTGMLTADQVLQVKDDGDGDPVIGTATATFYNAASGTVSAQQVQIRGFAEVTNDGTLTIEDRGDGVEQADLNVFNNASLIGGIPSTGIADFINNGIVSTGDDINFNSFGDFGGSTFSNNGIASADGTITVGHESFAEVTLYDNMAFATTLADHVQVHGASHFENAVGATVTADQDFSLRHSATLNNDGVINTADQFRVEDSAVATTNGTINATTNVEMHGGSLVNDGAVNAFGRFNMSNGAMVENSDIIDIGINFNIDDDSTVNNMVGGEITTADNINMHDDSVFTNADTVTVGAALRVEHNATFTNQTGAGVVADSIEISEFGTFDNDGTVTTANNVNVTDSGSFENASTFTLNVGEDLNVNDDATFDNTGVVNVADNMDVSDNAVWTNHGTGTVNAESMRIDDAGLFDNRGTLTIEGPDWLSVNESGRLENTGTLNVETVLAVKDDDDGDFVRGPGVPDATLHNLGTGVVNAYEMQVRGFVDVVNDGTISIANVAGDDDLSIFNDPTGGLATFTNNGTINIGDDITFTIVLDGSGGGETTIAGTAGFDGTLDFDLAVGFTPTVGETFDLFTYESFSGGFDDITGTDLGGGLTLDVTFGATAATATVLGPAAPGTIELGALDGSDGFALPGLDAGDASGVVVGAAGDVNGDGFGDFLVTTPGADGPTESTSFSGETYVVFGQASGWPASFDLDSLDGSNGSTVFGISNGDASGNAVAGGDINGDGFADIIVGASNEDESYVIFGQETWPASISPTTLDGSNGFKVFIDVGDYGDVAGRALSMIDVNGDGFDDIILGAPYGDGSGNDYTSSGEAYVVFGKAGGFSASVDLDTLDGSDGVKFQVNEDGYNVGRSLSLIGDVNGDGMNDFVIGAPGANDDTGGAYVVFGQDTWAATVDLRDLDGSDGFRVDGIDFDNRTGLAVSTAGDVNGDGFDDIVIGAPYVGGFYDRDGEAYVVFGGDSLGASIDLETLDGDDGFAITPVNDYDTLGHAVGGGGDVNGDGFDDILVGAPDRASFTGESYIVFGGDFTGTVTHAGDDGDNELTGTAGVDVMIGGRGGDEMTGDAGDDVLRGGAGDDVFVDTTFARIDGGTGYDILEHDGDLDLTALFARITGIEVIDISGTDDNTLTLDLEELLAVTDGPNLFAGDTANTLVIEGNTGDVVDVDNPADWTDSGTIDVGPTYSIYTHNDANASLVVNDEVSFV